MKTPVPVKFIASALSLVLVLTAPGLMPYSAMAQVMRSAPSVPVTGLGYGAGAMGAHGGAAADMGSAPSLEGVSGSLDLSGSPLQTPEGLRLSPAASNGGRDEDAASDEAAVQGNSAANSGASRRAPSMGRRAAQASKAVIQTGSIGSLSASEARTAGDKIQAALTGERSANSPVAAAAPNGSLGSIPSLRAGPSAKSVAVASSLNAAPEAPAPKAASPVLSSAVTVLRIAAAGAVVVGLNVGAAMLAPALFGFVAVPSAWAVASGAILFPVALFARYRLSKVADAKASRGPRWLMDAAIGGFAGAALTAFPQALGLSVTAGAHVISLGPILGLAALAATTTTAFYLPYITGAIRSGRQLRLPAQIAWPSIFWTGSGAVFALLSGFTAPAKFINGAFMAYNFLGKSRLFNLAYIGGFVYAAATAWTSPLTLPLIALFAERVSHWTVAGLQAMLKGGSAPIAGEEIAADKGLFDGVGKKIADANDRFKGKFPNFHYTLKSALLYGTMVGFLGLTGALVFGFKSIGTNLLISSVIMGAQFWFSDKLIIAAMQAKETKESDLPVVYKIVRELTQKAGVPMPKIYIVPMGVPNAFATGRSPNHALVGVTPEALELMDEREMRGVLAHEMSHVLNRDMVSSVVAGSMGSSIAFAAYSVMWSVTTAKRKVGEIFGLGSKLKDNVVPEGPKAQDKGLRPEFIEPVSSTIALTSLMGLFRVFAALWAPIIATVIQMSVSRTREFAADYDGGKLGQDPAALADALEKLTTWKPKPGMQINQNRLPFMLATAHMFTISPLEQLGMKQPVANKGVRALLGDSFLFDLFVTHPDTNERIARLRKMAEAMGQKTDKDPEDPGPGAGPFKAKIADGGPSEPAKAGGRSLPGLSEPSETAAVPGLDARLAPAVQAFSDRLAQADASAKLGHLGWAINEVLASGGAVRYAGLARNGMPVLAAFDPKTRSVYLSDMLRRTRPVLQAAVLASVLQEAYDVLKGRSGDPQQSAARKMAAVEHFLKDQDPVRLAHSLDLNNPAEGMAFESLMSKRMLYLSSRQEIEGTLKDYREELRLVRGRLAQGPNAELKGRAVVLEKTIEVLKGMADLARRKAEVNGAEPDAPMAEPQLAADGGRAAVDLAKLPVVEAKTPAPDAALEAVLALVRRAIAQDPERSKSLGYILATLERMEKEGGRIHFGQTPPDAGAFFSPVSLDLVVNSRYRGVHPALLGTLLVHELTHADDYFQGRSMTRETENRAFTAMAVFLGAFEAKKVARELDMKNEADFQAYNWLYSIRRLYVSGQINLEAMISNSYAQMFNGHFNGMLSAAAMLREFRTSTLLPARQQYEELRSRAELLASKGKPGSARARRLEAVRRSMAILQGRIAFYERMAAQYTREAAASESRDPGPMGGSGSAPLSTPGFGGGWDGVGA